MTTPHPPAWTYPAGQLTPSDVKALTPEEYVQAEETGLLDKHLGRAPRPPAEGQLTRTDLKHMTPQQIVDARDRGQFDQLLSGEAP
ncbi:hypothetical protein [Streptomyces sp. NPDC091416]|uniref:hypothetical protein n=1 Tax=Streptomyces sp. NPDC091416 TaxID=3366003 RepID=UPI00380C5546